MAHNPRSLILKMSVPRLKTTTGWVSPPTFLVGQTETGRGPKHGAFNPGGQARQQGIDYTH